MKVAEIKKRVKNLGITCLCLLNKVENFRF